MKETKRKPEERPCVHSPHFSLTSATQSFFFAAGFRLLHWNTASSKPWSVSQLLISCTRCGKGKYECMTWTRLYPYRYLSSDRYSQIIAALSRVTKGDNTLREIESSYGIDWS